MLFSSKSCRPFRSGLSLVLAVLLTVGAPVFADGPVEIRAKDVALAEAGLLNGAVLNSAAQPLPDVRVNVLHGEKVVATLVTDHEGRFAVRGLRNGAHIIQIGQNRHAVRFWTANAAPPSATNQLAIVVEDDLVRGQGMIASSSVASAYSSTTAAFLVVGAGVAVTLGTTLGTDDYQQPASP